MVEVQTGVSKWQPVKVQADKARSDSPNMHTCTHKITCKHTHTNMYACNTHTSYSMRIKGDLIHTPHHIQRCSSSDLQ